MFRQPTTLNEKNLCLAISARRMVSLFYDGGIRLCAPFLIGVTTAGNVGVRLWQLSGFSRSGEKLPWWRLFTADKIRNLVILQESFLDIPPLYNPKDKGFVDIWLAVDLSSQP